MSDLSSRLNDLKTKLRLDEIQTEKESLLKEMEAGDFWGKPDAQKKSQRLAEINDILDTHKAVESAISDAETAELMLADDYENPELIADNER
jgi:protein subunit release factor A